ncbi:MAG: hypothetical protein QOJ97_1742 [Solirubrobacteraceae bacterium]|nr:hypothetical protein [Solirubrobacteraceae bacterium]
MYVLWSGVQPARGAAPNWDAPGTGGFSPRAQLRAVRAAGFEPVVTFYSTPAWAAQPPLGCEPPRPNVNARAPRADALPAYRALVTSFLAMARAEGAGVRYLSAWNEPNSGLFLAPQRGTCVLGAPSVGTAPYAALVRELKAALDAAPGEQEIVVGELSSPYEPRPLISSVAEFVERLPHDVLCAGRIWAQHQYAGDADGVAEVQVALRSVPCAPRTIWVTETGVGARRPGAPRSYAPARLASACRSLDRLLRRWYRDPQVEAAFQYTLREDPNFPVGLASAAGGPAYPTYDLWRAWGARDKPTDPPPPLPVSCR